MTTRTGFNPPSAAATPGVLHVEDQKTTGTAGGTFTSGARRTRDLNTVVTNTITGASLAANQVSLPAGTYDVEWFAMARGVVRNRTWLRDVGGGVDLLAGTSSLANSSTAGPSFGRGRIVPTGTVTLELQHQAENTTTTDGFGVATSFGPHEVYSWLIIRQVL